MAELSTIARPYAEAAFRLARDAGSLSIWTDALQRLAAVASRPEAIQMFGNPKVTATQLAGIIGESSGALTAEQKNFVQLLADNERLPVLSEISHQFEALRSSQEGIVDAHITSAYPLTDVQAADIQKTLESKTGKKVKISVAVDGELIGGVSIRIGDEVTDLSVKGKLAQLQKALVA